MGTIEQGVGQAVENCLKVKPGERALVITDAKGHRSQRQTQTRPHDWNYAADYERLWTRADSASNK